MWIFWKKIRLIIICSFGVIVFLLLKKTTHPRATFLTKPISLSFSARPRRSSSSTSFRSAFRNTEEQACHLYLFLPSSHLISLPVSFRSQHENCGGRYRKPIQGIKTQHCYFNWTHGAVKRTRRKQPLMVTLSPLIYLYRPPLTL